MGWGGGEGGWGAWVMKLGAATHAVWIYFALTFTLDAVLEKRGFSVVFEELANIWGGSPKTSIVMWKMMSGVDCMVRRNTNVVWGMLTLGSWGRGTNERSYEPSRYVVLSTG